MLDFSKTLIRCSSIGCIMTDPQSKADKDKGELSKTCKSHLVKIYNMERFGRRTDILTKYMDKGIQVEEDAITLLSRVDKKFYKKNEERISNEWITGLPDLYDGESIYFAQEITDIKSSWNLDTFMANILSPLDKDYEYQGQGYCALTGAKKATIAYCLVSSPDGIIEQEKYSLLRRMNVATEEAPEFKAAAAQLEYSMLFDDIPMELRVLKFEIQRDDELIDKIYQKVGKCREFLTELAERHENFNKKAIAA